MMNQTFKGLRENKANLPTGRPRRRGTEPRDNGWDVLYKQTQSARGQNVQNKANFGVIH